jgi:DNA replication protein DnaC
MSNEQTLPIILKELRLSTINQQWQSYSETAISKGWSYPKYLATLAELELARRVQNRTMRNIKISKLPAGKTIDTFDFTAAKSINKAQIQAFIENNDWVKQANNLILFGPSGVGKTHLAAAIGYSMAQQNIKVLFTSTTAIVQQLQKARSEYRLNEELAKIARVPLLIMDDISYVKKNEVETSVLFELIANRYESSSIIITSNQPFGEWDQIFPDNMMAVAAIDRVIHHATIINITEDSYRKSHCNKS